MHKIQSRQQNNEKNIKVKIRRKRVNTKKWNKINTHKYISNKNKQLMRLLKTWQCIRAAENNDFYVRGDIKSKNLSKLILSFYKI